MYRPIVPWLVPPPRDLHKHLALVALFATVSVAGLRPANAQDSRAQQRTLSVSGEGEVRSAPDMASINVGVVTQADEAAAAVEQNNQAMQQLIATLKEQGVAEKDIQTVEFSVTPQYRRDRPDQQQPPTIVGYQVTNSVQIRVHKLQDLGGVLDLVVQQGANQINSISFSIQEPAPLLDEARRKAVADARRKAETYAQAADVRLGKILTLDDASASIPRPYMQRGGRLAAAEASVPIQAGEQSLTARVSLTFEIAE